jgi:divalent metal cation (Fe/Co/Zn/Cd) transporter
MATRAKDLRHAGWLSVFSIVWSGIAGSIAVYAASVSGSLSLVGFGVDAVIDSAASLTLVWRFLVESREPDRAARVERIGESVVGAALIVLAVYLLAGSVRSLAAQSHTEGSDLSVALLVASLVVLPPLAAAKYKVARRLESGALRLDSILTAVAAFLAAISLGSAALATAFGFWWADAIAAALIAVIVLREGMGTLAARRST